MAESVREQALEALRGRLGTMTGVRFWGGTYPAALTTERIFRGPVQVHQYPYLCIVAASGSSFQAGALGVWVHRLAVTIYGYVRGDTMGGVSRSTWLQRLHEDVRRTLVADATLGGLATDILWGDEEVEENSAEDGVAMFAQDLIVQLAPVTV